MDHEIETFIVEIAENEFEIIKVFILTDPSSFPRFNKSL